MAPSELSSRGRPGVVDFAGGTKAAKTLLKARGGGALRHHSERLKGRTQTYGKRGASKAGAQGN